MTVIRGQHIPRPDGKPEDEVLNPYVKVRINGHTDESKNEQQTHPGKGINPIWDVDTFRFPVKLFSLAFTLGFNFMKIVDTF